VNSSYKKSQGTFPDVPDKQYFSIGEVSKLCNVKAHVLRYWEGEFNQLKPIKRKGNRRYYKVREVLLVRKIRTLLYDEGYTINGAKIRLSNDLNQKKIQVINDDLLPHKPNKKNVEQFANLGVFSDNKQEEYLTNELSEILDILRGSQDGS
jgi:DNA-binding transcriptional MerR regulator